MKQNNKESQNNQKCTNYSNEGKVGTTSTSLLLGLQSGDNERWKAFADVYTPLVQYWCKKPAGITLTYVQIQDIVQEVFMSVHAKIKEFDIYRENRSFRAWLRTITNHKISDFLDKYMKNQRTVALTNNSSALNNFTAKEIIQVDELCERQILMQRVLERVRPVFSQEYWDVFNLFIHADKTSSEVSQAMGMKPDTVRKIKNRMLHRIRQECVALGLDGELPILGISPSFEPDNPFDNTNS